MACNKIGETRNNGGLNQTCAQNKNGSLLWYTDSFPGNSDIIKGAHISKYNDLLNYLKECKKDIIKSIIDAYNESSSGEIKIENVKLTATVITNLKQKYGKISSYYSTDLYNFILNRIDDLFNDSLSKDQVFYKDNTNTFPRDMLRSLLIQLFGFGSPQTYSIQNRPFQTIGAYNVFLKSKKNDADQARIKKEKERLQAQAKRLQAERLQAERLQAERLQAERLQAENERLAQEAEKERQAQAPGFNILGFFGLGGRTKRKRCKKKGSRRNKRTRQNKKKLN